MPRKTRTAKAEIIQPTLEEWFARQDKAVEQAHQAMKRNRPAERVPAEPAAVETLPASSQERINALRVQHSQLVCHCVQLGKMITDLQAELDSR